MNEMEILEEIKSCFAELLGVSNVKKLAKKALDMNIQIDKIIDAMKRGLDEAGRKYEVGEYFLSDLIMGGLMATEFTNMVKPYLTPAEAKPEGKVVIGTVKGDIHDIGKNLVTAMLSSQNFEVIDIGVDVPPERFAESVKQYKPDIVAMSCLLTIGMPEIQKTIELIRRNNLKVEIMIGGRPITREFADELGVKYGRDAFEAVKVARMLVESRDEE